MTRGPHAYGAHAACKGSPNAHTYMLELFENMPLSPRERIDLIMDDLTPGRDPNPVA